MPVSVARSAGFCMGVRRAVNGALHAAQSGEEIVSYGELAHNPELIRSLCERGIQVIHQPEEAAGKTVLIRSHGVAPSVMEALRRTAKRVEDLTCPFVARLHRVVSEYSRSGLPVILVGQGDHPEVIGTIGYAFGSVYTIQTLEEAAQLPRLPQALIVSQTTLPEERWNAILPVVEERVGSLTVEKTICTATAQRQSEAARLAADSDAVIVIGGRQSANTRKLYETCKGICANTILVERASEIPASFANIHSDSIGITAGASTPDWSLKEVVTTMTDKEQINQEDFMSQMEATLVKIRPGQIIKGTVLTINDEFVGVNIGYKSDGLMKREDLITDDVKPGDEIEVEVLKVNDGEGNVLLSQRKIQNRKAVAELVQKKESGEYVEGVGKEAVKGGLLCIVNGIRAFVPASQLSTRFVTNIADYVGQPMKLKILEVDEAKGRIVASRRAVLEEERAAKLEETWAKLVEGEIVHGIVRRLTNFGAFVDLGGLDGLIRIPDLCWYRITDPSEVVSVNQEVDVKVLKLYPEKKVSLSLKELQPQPWEVALEKYPVGSIVTGKVVRIPEKNFGAFVSLEPGLDGLIHISQCADHRIEKVTDAVNIGDEVTVKVLNVDPENKRISLSIRALQIPDAAPAEEAPVEEAAAEEAVAEEAPVEEAAAEEAVAEEAPVEEAAAEETENN